jgi:hypothetical protein
MIDLSSVPDAFGIFHNHTQQGSDSVEMFSSEDVSRL